MEKKKNNKITRGEALHWLETARKLKREYVARPEKGTEKGSRRRTGQEVAYFEVW